MSSKWTVQELNIPVPYGHIAARVWGSENAEPVLAFHGWQDNAATFDRLIPLLSANLKIVAIDLPGHGLSSHKPIGAFYHPFEILVDIRRVVDYLKFDRFSLIGHSMGGGYCLLYSSLFPEQIKNIVLFDFAKVGSRKPDYLPDLTREGIESLLSIENKMSNPSPVYSYEEARQRLMSGMFVTSSITAEAADVILTRGCKPSACGKGVVFSRDIRVKVIDDLQKMSHEDLKAYMKRIKSNMMIIVGNESIIYFSRTPEVLDEFFDIYKKNCQSFKLIKVDGNHFFHLNNPETVAPHVDSFFREHI